MIHRITRKDSWAVVLVLGLAAHGAYGQSTHYARVGAGWESYQVLPVTFTTPDDELYAIRNTCSSAVVYTGYGYRPEEGPFMTYIDLMWERSVSDVHYDNSPVGEMTVDHVAVIGGMVFYYLHRENWGLGSGVGIGLGGDIARFSGPQLEYSDFDYHYQLDLVSFRWGTRYGIHADAGFGVRGWVRGGLFVRL